MSSVLLRRTSAGLLALAFAAGCLPEAEPGVGERILAGRGMADVLLPRLPAATTVPTVLFSREIPQAQPEDGPPVSIRRDLFAYAPGEAAPQAVAEDYDYFAPITRPDARGRLVIRKGSEFLARETGFAVRLLDPGTRTLEQLGQMLSIQLSGSGQWLLYERTGGEPAVRSVATDREHHLGGRLAMPGLLGEELFFRMGDRLMRLRPNDETPREIAAGVTAWWPLAGRAAPSVLIARASGGEGSPFFVLETSDPVAQPRPLTTARTTRGYLFVSPEGGRVVLAEPPPRDSAGPVRVQVISVDDGSQWGIELPLPPPPRDRYDPPDEPPVARPPSIGVAFRPGSAQLWFFLNQRLYVVSPDGSLSFVDRQVQTHLYIEPLGASGSPTLASGEGRWQVLPIFSADGARWLFRGEDGRVRLGDANHPEDEGGPVVASSDLGGNTEIYELAPGGPLAVIRAVLGTRRDLHLVEAPWQSTRLLLADVATVTFGAGRALAVARKSQGGGDLLLVDLVTGDETRLGQNVVQAALAPACPGCDPTAPGTILAYVVQARVPYRLDGLWLGTLP